MARNPKPPDGYFSNLRHQLVDMIAPLPARVLEIGCGTGNTLAHLKSLGVNQTVGVELVPEVAEQATARADHVITGDVELMELPFKEGHFDCLVLGDVLEHLRDPWTTLARLATLLRTGGQVVASVPNVRFYEVSLPLVLWGAWKYECEGVLDRTHLRFFTKDTIADLFASSGLRIVRIGAHRGPKREVLNWLTFGILRNLLAIQHLVKAVKP